jgi:adenylate cyclase
MPITPSSGPQVVRFGVYEVDLRAGELRKQGLRIRLPEQPFQVLAILLEHPGEVITREDLQKRLWPDGTFVDFEQGLNAAVKRLREVLGDSAESPHFIETLARRGYRFIESLAASPGRIESLAVLPLANLSGDPEQEYFAEGLTEALIMTLAKIGALRVISRTSAMRYKNTDKSLPQIARELNVDAVVEGTVQRSGVRVRISAQLLHAPTDAHLWAENYDRDMRDVLALQSEVAQAIAREIQVKLTPVDQARLAEARPVVPEAYECYLKGRFFWNKRTADGMAKGAEYFQLAIDRDPTYALAYTGLADSATRLGFWGHVRPEQGCLRGKAAASKALELDDTLAEAHASLGFAILHYDFSIPRAEEECRRAMELDPRSSSAAQLRACCLIAAGRAEEGAAEALRAVQLDPLSLPLQWTAGVFLYFARQYDRAIEECYKLLELDPNFALARWTIALCLVKKGMYDAAITEMETAVRALGHSQSFLGALGYCYAAAGRKEEMQKVLNQLHEISKQHYVSVYWSAMAAPAIEKRDDALRGLEAARREHVPWMPYVRLAPYFDDLRSDARFQDLMHHMNFPGEK